MKILNNILTRVCILTLMMCTGLLLAQQSLAQNWSIIDRKTIETYNLRSVSEALELAAGFGTVRTYVKHRIGTARGVLQPHYSNRVLILIDGTPAWLASTGEAYLDRVGIDDIERIEVQTGPSSILHGTQAYTGVVNLILRKANSGEDTQSSFVVGVGSPTRYEASGRVAWNRGAFTGSFGASQNEIDGLEYNFTDEAGNTGRVQDYLNAATFSANGSYRTGASTHTVLVNAFRTDESFLGATPTFALGMGQDNENRGVLGTYTFAHTLSERLSVEANVSYDGSARDSARSRTNQLRTDIRGYRLSGRTAALARLSERSLLRIGLDFDNRNSQRYNSFNPLTGQVLETNQMQDRSVEEHSLFTQYEYSGERWSGSAGARFIDNELFGNHTTLASALAYRFDSNHALAVRASQSYRSPTLFELYFQPTERTVYGSIDLQPETSDVLEVEYTGQLGALSLQTTLYRAWYDKHMTRRRFAPNDPTDTLLVYTNGAEFAGSGLELESRYRFGSEQSGEVFLNYSYLANTEDTGAFRYVPSHTWSLGIAREFGEWKAAALANYRSDTDGPKQDIQGQFRVDVNVSYHQRVRNLELNHVFAVSNLTDEALEYPEYVRQNLNSIPYGFGRSYIYTLRVAFR